MDDEQTSHSPKIVGKRKKSSVDGPRPSRAAFLSDCAQRQDGSGEMPKESRTRSEKRRAIRVWMR